MFEEASLAETSLQLSIMILNERLFQPFHYTKTPSIVLYQSWESKFTHCCSDSLQDSAIEVDKDILRSLLDIIFIVL
jgi:hypothetical protein